ncbi:ATP synthase subunit delta, mitochondrial [Basidiobolus meristosporus CBS 931.73]|uniref:ATP synthase subunit delta, mitochondrial n=1 Tax=Basidiobolus meristosporus CBS 931.73 TaxID=1314790 RepID=A0A1Y1YP59_9FUNG|nr:ATP synthase subunit delta, mitochondrial [Basidiobolus meristosporus CBS 931.73]|eukprot:ORX99791.1 ATP synthase subunit delta, mitochondrial [Basidiobolus meristosporus CBS 931.73]
MNFLARTARAVRPARFAIRGYATDAPAVNDKLVLNFVLPHQVLFKKTAVQQVNLASTSGDMGILANHVPSIEQLRPGVLEVITEQNTQKWFVSGGFAIVNPDSTLNINAVEAFPLDDFSPEAVKEGLDKANQILGSNASEQEKVVAKIEQEVFEALQSAVGKSA